MSRIGKALDITDSTAAEIYSHSTPILLCSALASTLMGLETDPGESENSLRTATLADFVVS